jgi:hypothetical protein
MISKGRAPRSSTSGLTRPRVAGDPARHRERSRTVTDPAPSTRPRYGPALRSHQAIRSRTVTPTLTSPWVLVPLTGRRVHARCVPDSKVNRRDSQSLAGTWRAPVTWRLAGRECAADDLLSSRSLPVRTFCTDSFKAVRRAARAAASAASPALPLVLPLRRAKRRSAGAKSERSGLPRRTAFTGSTSRSVIIRGGQNPSRAPSASASPQTLD